MFQFDNAYHHDSHISHVDYIMITWSTSMNDKYTNCISNINYFFEVYVDICVCR